MSEPTTIKIFVDCDEYYPYCFVREPDNDPNYHTHDVPAELAKKLLRAAKREAKAYKEKVALLKEAGIE